ncbi:hypothetical protein COEREDRAFT_90704 [Coemansia reversa NRRL 1564]|uniref:Secreted protein n=1 Tax=Coemansia reversa (strain ATCC 12441 / NRRL 1564) TaxID=763665 RepID=A0A2G5BKV6_COERN|nr:hypothetical protein COEREDRAFT_90704 [Coemansia reversa NRRL 1564]|eukprot:PIA19397.1 hypothetical protein COEREDRAFT_90704 [Coemansia reversa NRRL 1564]
MQCWMVELLLQCLLQLGVKRWTSESGFFKKRIRLEIYIEMRQKIARLTKVIRQVDSRKSAHRAVGLDLSEYLNKACAVRALLHTKKQSCRKKAHLWHNVF